MKEVTQALAFIASKHRHTGLDPVNQPFIHHPVLVLNELVQANITDTATLVAGVLHDILQKSDTTIDEIENLFGLDVAQLVTELYYDPNLQGDELQLLLLDRQVDLSDQAQQIVIADLIANINDICDEGTSKDNHELRVAFANALLAETPEPHDELTAKFKQLIADVCVQNNINQEQSYWARMSESDRQELIERLSKEVTELEEELGDDAV